jgi:hypothetical protein
MVVVTVVVMSLGGERRTGKHHQDQKERGCENLFHGTNVARPAKVWKTVVSAASKEETGAAGAGVMRGLVFLNIRRKSKLDSR